MTDADLDNFMKLEKLLERMTLEEIKRFCNGTLMSLALGQKVFKERFPGEWKKWEDEL